MPSSGAPPGFPDCPLSLKQWDCPRSSSEHALHLVRKTLLKGRRLFPLHGALPLLLWDEVRESPTREAQAGRAALWRACGWIITCTRHLIRRRAVGSHIDGARMQKARPAGWCGPGDHPIIRHAGLREHRHCHSLPGIRLFPARISQSSPQSPIFWISSSNDHHALRERPCKCACFAKTPAGCARTIQTSPGKARTPANAAAPGCRARSAIRRRKTIRHVCRRASSRRTITDEVR